MLPLLDPAEARQACKPFIGYSDLTAMLTFLTITCGIVAFHGPMLAGRLGRGEARLRPRVVRCTRSAAPSRWASWRRRALETIRPGEATGPLLGGTLTQLLASLGTAVRVRSARGLRAVSGRSGRAPVPARSDGDAAAADRPAGAGVRRSSLASCRAATSRRAARPREAVIADLFADFPGPVVRRLSVGPHDGAGDDAAVRRQAAAWSRAPSRDSSSRRARSP